MAYLNDEYDSREFEVIQNVLENETDGRSKIQHLGAWTVSFFLKWLTEENENTPHMTRCFKTQIVFY